jgi:hypothetical protein
LALSCLFRQWLHSSHKEWEAGQGVNYTCKIGLHIRVLLADLMWSGIFQFHPLLSITPLPQVQNLGYGNVLVLQEKFDN